MSVIHADCFIYRDTEIRVYPERINIGELTLFRMEATNKQLEDLATGILGMRQLTPIIPADEPKTSVIDSTS